MDREIIIDNPIYTRKKEIISGKLGMSNTSLGLEFYNLGYITQYDGLTPEQFDGTDEGIYPRPFQIRLRLTASF